MAKSMSVVKARNEKILAFNLFLYKVCGNSNLTSIPSLMIGSAASAALGISLDTFKFCGISCGGGKPFC